jgi:predicted small integral membrane protein
MAASRLKGFELIFPIVNLSKVGWKAYTPGSEMFFSSKTHCFKAGMSVLFHLSSTQNPHA